MGEFSLVVAIANTGFSEVIMQAAKDAGAHGGTIVHARGAAPKDIEKKYGFAVTPEKEMLLVVVPNDICDAVMTAIDKSAGIDKPAQSIVFSLPVSHATGLKIK